MSPDAISIVRTLAYHQLTMLTGGEALHTGGFSPSKLSADGNRAAFLVGDPARVFVIDADGTDLREVDAHPAGGYTNVDISADGSKVLSWYGESGTGAGVARIVNADGTNAHEVLSIGNGKFFRLSADGLKVYFASGGNFDFGGSSHNAGLYVINADGTGLQQILDIAQVHTYFGKPITDPPFYWAGQVPFAVSEDGSHIVLQLWVQDIGYPIMRVNGNGAGLQAYSLFPAGYYSYVANLGISGDGTKVFYELIRDPWELGVFDWDGADKVVLASGVGGANTGGEIVQLTYDGTKLSYGSLNRLYNTDGSGVLQLAATGPTVYGDPPLMVGSWGLFRSSMNSNATRFLFTFDNDAWIGGVKQPRQLGILEVNPAGLGQSPSLANPQIVPPYVVKGDGSTTAFSVQMSTANTHLRTNGVVFRDGLAEDNSLVYDAILYDDGSNGDPTAGDGVYTNNVIRANSGAPVGPRTVRFKTEVRAADNRRHATALDVAKLDVVTEIPPPEPPDLTVSHLEVNQAIQRDDNSVLLIAYKRTVVRAFIAIGEPAGPVSNVTGRLKGYQGATLLGMVEPFNPGRSIAAYKTPDWRQINQTLNFEVPFSWLTGNLRLEVEVNPSHSVTEGDYTNNTTSITVVFVDGGGRRIAWLPVHYAAAGYAGPQDPGARVAKGAAWLIATYPVSQTRVKYYRWPGFTWASDVNTGTGAIDLLLYLNRLLQLSQVSPKPDHLYGWLPGGVYGGNGLAWMPGHTAMGNDTDGRWRRTFAHELTHNLNLGHNQWTIGVHGFDVAAREVKVETKRDLTWPAQLEQDAWIHPVIYEYLYTQRAQAAQTAARPQAGSAVEYLLASGVINAGGTGSLNSFYRQVQAEPSPNPPVGTGAYCLELYDAVPVLLASQCFDISFGFGDSTAVMTSAPFALSIPFPPTTTRIDLKKGVALLASRPVSSHAPVVSISSLTGDVVKTINWTATDQDGGTLTYSVMYSADNKASWFAVATDLTQTTYSLDTSKLPGGASAYVRILASDGVNTGQADAGPFAVVTKGPDALITAPVNGATFALGERVLLSGDGFDPEEGSLAAGALTWSSSLDGALGSGSWLERADLSEGRHTITLTVVDGDGKTATDSVTITIGNQRLYLPLIRR